MADSFSYTLASLKSRRLMWATFHGEVTMKRIAESYPVYQNHPDLGPGIDELLDFSHASVATMGSKDFEIIRLFMKNEQDRHHSMSAIVVSSKLEYGLSRMMGGLMDVDVPVNRGVFYSVETALKWLRPGQVDELLAAHEKALAPDSPRTSNT